MAIDPHRIACRDGVVFFVRERATGTIVVSALHDDAVSLSCGLSRSRAPHRPGEAYAEHTSMPVERVRAYAIGHVGVAEGGPVAVALLKRLPSEASKGAEGVAPSASFPAAGGSGVAGRPEASAVPGAPDQRLGAGLPQVEVDVLTPEIIDARRFLAVLDGPHLLDG